MTIRGFPWDSRAFSGTPVRSPKRLGLECSTRLWDRSQHWLRRPWRLEGEGLESKEQHDSQRQIHGLIRTNQEFAGSWSTVQMLEPVADESRMQDVFGTQLKTTILRLFIPIRRVAVDVTAIPTRCPRNSYRILRESVLKPSNKEFLRIS